MTTARKHDGHVRAYVASKTFYNHRQCKRLARLFAKKFPNLDYDTWINRIQSYRRRKVEWLHDWEDVQGLFQRGTRLALEYRHRVA